MRTLKLLCLIITILIGFSQISFAQGAKGSEAKTHEQQTAEEKKTVVLEDIIVTGSRRETLLKDCPQSVTLITSEDIERSAAQKLDELLRQRVPGINFKSYGGADLCEMSNVSLRGVGPGYGRILVLVDGIPQHDATQEFVRWNLFPLNDIDRIEVIRGPSSALYGSKAMGGVINIITKRPTKPSETSIKASYGDLYTYNTQLLQMGKLGNFGYSISGAVRRTDGYIAEKEPFDFSIKRYRKDNILNGKIFWNMDEKSTLILGGKYLDARVGEGRSTYFTKRYTSGFWLDYQRKDPNTFDLHGTFYFNQDEWKSYEDTWEDNYASIEKISTADPFQYWGGTIYASIPIALGNILTVGFEGRNQKLEWNHNHLKEPERVHNLGAELRYLAGFLQDEMYLLGDKLIFTAGIRYDYSKFHNGWAYDSDPSESYGEPYNKPYYLKRPSKEQGEFSPKLGVVYHLTNQTTLRGSVARAFRFPSMESLYVLWPYAGGLWEGNPDLESETMISYEIGVTHSFFDKKGFFKATAYKSEADDYIFAETKSVSPVYHQQFENIDKVRIYGVETELQYQISKHWSFFADYTYNVSEVRRYDDNPALEGEELPYCPHHKFGVGVSYDNPRILRIDADMRYTSWRYDVLMWEWPEYAKLPGYSTYNLKLSKKLNRFTEVSLAVENIFDNEYEVTYSPDTGKLLLAPGRLITGGVTVNF